MKKLLIALILAPSIASANDFEYSLSAKSLYGYATKEDKSTMPTDVELGLSYTHKNVSLYLDLYAGFDKQNQTYNQGDWGQEAYAILSNNWGDLQVGQMYNVAKQFYVGAFEYTDFNITDFIANSSWTRDDNKTSYATFNTTAINTDGVAPKISYISPEIYSSYIGLSYTPDAYNRRGLTTKEAKAGYIASILNNQKIGAFDVATSLSYAYFEDIDEEYSASIKVSYGNYNISGGYRKSDANGSSPIELYNAYRQSNSYDIGAGFNFGPYEAKISYINSKSDKFDYQDEYVAITQKYQINKYFDIYLIGAYANFNNDQPQEGYAAITGLKINL